MKEFKPILANRMFLYLWTSQILSQLTINIMNFLLLIRLFTITESSIATSLLWVAYALPSIFLGPIGAASVDLVSKRKMLLWTNFLQAFSIFIYAIFHQTRIFLLYGVVLAYSLLNQFYVPAEAASLPSLIERKHLPQANSLFFLTQQAALILGFGVAGLLNRIFGFTTTLYLCAAFIFIAFIACYFLPTMEAKQTLPSEFEDAIKNFASSILAGYRFIKEKRQVVAPFLILGGVQIITAILVVNVPLLAREIFAISFDSAGIAIVVPAGVGAMVGAFAIARLLKAGWRKKRVIEISLLAASISIGLLVFALPSLLGLLRAALGALIIAVAGFSFVGVTIPSQTYLQEATPEELRGRVFGNFWFLVTVATIFPVIFSGTITELLGIKTLLTIIGAGALAVLIYSMKFGESFLRKEA